jgi:DNA-binding CsgD family transcriptional regulator
VSAVDWASILSRRDALVRTTGFIDTLAGRPAAMLVEGAAGIGKTTVWRAATAAAIERGCRVVSTTAVEGEADLAFVGLRDLLETVPADAAAALPAAQRDALEVALLRSDDPAALAEPHAVCVAVLGVVRVLAAERPLVIAVDDVGWLDRSSERVLRYVVRRLVSEPVGVLATRLPDDGPVPFGLDTSPAAPRLTHLTLGPMPARDVHELLTERHEFGLSRRVIRRIAEVSGGNPFAALEIGRAVHTSGRQVLDGDALPLPTGILQVTTQRIAALSPAARRALAVVSVAGTGTVPLVAATVGDDTEDALDEAETQGLLEVGESVVRFPHPLLRAAAAASLSRRQRRRLHRELATLVSDPDQRAIHLAAGAATPDAAVAATLDLAAERAFAHGAPETAARLAARAAALTPPDEVEAVARRRIRTAEYDYHAEAAQTVLTELIDQLPAGDLRAEALLWLACVRQARDGMAETVELARRSLADATSNELRAAAERHLALALVIVGDDVPAGVRHATASLVSARASADPKSIAESQAALAWTQFWLGSGLRTELLEGARGQSTWSRFAPQESSPNVVVGLLYGWADEVTQARAALHAEDRRRTELGQDRPRAVLLFSLAELECRAGQWSTALRHAEDGLRIAELVGDDFYRALLFYARGLVTAHQGGLEEARADADRAVAIGRRIGSAVPVGFAATLLGFIGLSTEDHVTVDAHLAPLSATLAADGRFDPGLARFLPDHVEALTALGRTEPAAELLAPFDAQATRLDRPWALAAAGRCRALLHAAAGDFDAALAAADRAVVAHERVDLPFERARTLLVAGVVQRRGRRRRDARRTLEAARGEFDRLGATAWSDRAGDEIGRLGGRAPSPRHLTASEQRIAEQVADGLTNKEVAAALFLSVSTVESALWKIYRKLNVRSRTELAAYLRNPLT